MAKLFAKHIKLADSIDYVKKTRYLSSLAETGLSCSTGLIRCRIGIGIGTPQRIKDLIESKALKITNLCRIVVDGSYLDQKKRSIFDMKELFVPTLQVLLREDFRSRYGISELPLHVLVLPTHQSAEIKWLRGDFGQAPADPLDPCQGNGFLGGAFRMRTFQPSDMHSTGQLKVTKPV